MEALHLMDDTGRRVLVLRGRLEPQGGERGPHVAATLLDADGRPLDTRTVELLQRLDGSDLAPNALAGALASGSERARADTRLRGFTLLIADPPRAARRFRLELSSGQRT